jgi:hypothetical protein
MRDRGRVPGSDAAHRELADQLELAAAERLDGVQDPQGASADSIRGSVFRSARCQ